ncbi:TerB family tellurite resistance protein [Campylobacter concisus]|uniref:TerB family tellurite resistance protein n=1 Tax=Campylobacter concisus TaxID=199 RepID=UPI00122D3F12
MFGVLFLLILGGVIFFFKKQANANETKFLLSLSEAMFLVSLLAKVAKSDGRVSELEARLITQALDDLSQKISGISGVREYLKEVYSSQKENMDNASGVREYLKEVYNREKENVDNAYEIAKAYKRAFNLNYDTCVAKLTFFLNLAYIDGEFNKSEQDIIRNIAYGFGIDKETLDEIIFKFDSFYGSRFGADRDEVSRENDAFEVLGLSKNASLDEVKARYKELVRQYHPDILMGRGESKDVIERSTKKLQEINEAYGRLKEKFGV